MNLICEQLQPFNSWSNQTWLTCNSGAIDTFSMFALQLFKLTETQLKQEVSINLYKEELISGLY